MDRPIDEQFLSWVGQHYFTGFFATWPVLVIVAVILARKWRLDELQAGWLTFGASAGLSALWFLSVPLGTAALTIGSLVWFFGKATTWRMR